MKHNIVMIEGKPEDIKHYVNNLQNKNIAMNNGGISSISVREIKILDILTDKQSIKEGMQHILRGTKPYHINNIVKGLIADLFELEPAVIPVGIPEPVRDEKHPVNIKLLGVKDMRDTV